MFDNIEFANPLFLWILLSLVFPIAGYIFYHKKQQAILSISSIKGFTKSTHIFTRLRPLLFLLRIAALALLILAIARPQTLDVSVQKKTNKGIDILMSIDVSSSMLAEDLKPNRLEALKRVASDFINSRVSDRIGLVVYAGESYTKTPLTADKTIVKNALREIKNNNLIQDGTAIGMGLATAVNRLKDSKAKSKIIILLTDGKNNSGVIDPNIASELAIEYGIKVYTIGVGSNGNARAPVGIYPNGKFQFGMVKVEIDEKLLKNIAEKTGGLYFRATNNKKLRDVYKEIDKLEKTEIEEIKYYNYKEKFRLFVVLGLILLVLEWILKNTLFKSFI